MCNLYHTTCIFETWKSFSVTISHQKSIDLYTYSRFDLLTLASKKWGLIMGIRASTFSVWRSLGRATPTCGPSPAPTATTLWLEDFLLVTQRQSQKQMSEKCHCWCFLLTFIYIRWFWSVPWSSLADEDQGTHNNTGQGDAHTDNDPCHWPLVYVVQTIRVHWKINSMITQLHSTSQNAATIYCMWLQQS